MVPVNKSRTCWDSCTWCQTVGQLYFVRVMSSSAGASDFSACLYWSRQQWHGGATIPCSSSTLNHSSDPLDEAVARNLLSSPRRLRVRNAMRVSSLQLAAHRRVYILCGRQHHDRVAGCRSRSGGRGCGSVFIRAGGQSQSSGARQFFLSCRNCKTPQLTWRPSRPATAFEWLQVNMTWCPRDM